MCFLFVITSIQMSAVLKAVQVVKCFALDTNGYIWMRPGILNFVRPSLRFKRNTCLMSAESSESF